MNRTEENLTTADIRALTPEQAREFSQRHPYCILADVSALPAETDPGECARFRARIAAAVGDTDTLMNLFGVDTDDFSGFYPDMHAPELSTEDTIDSFLTRFAPAAGLPADPLQLAPAIDYATILAAEEQSAPAADNMPAPAPAAETAPAATQEAAPAPEETALSESFARILIKNRNYEKALEIITELSLNNPEKSVYFADQIRFLRKLIFNERKSKY